MARSSYKINYVNRVFFKKKLENKKFIDKLNVGEHLIKLIKDNLTPLYFFFWVRNSNINKNIVSNKLRIFNGYQFLGVNLSNDSVGFKLGEFSITRRKPNHKGKQKQGKKIIKRYRKNKWD